MPLEVVVLHMSLMYVSIQESVPTEADFSGRLVVSHSYHVNFLSSSRTL
jgi:hypothetical protein